MMINSRKKTYLAFVILLAIFSNQLVFSQASVWLAKGEKAFNQQKYEEAISALTKVIQHQPSNTKAYGLRAQAYLFSSKFEQCIEDYNQAIRQDPKVADFYNSRGLAYGYIGQINPAISDFDKAIELDQKFTEAYLNRGSAYVSLMNFPQALKDFNSAIKLDSKNPEIYFQRGRVNYKQKKYNNAVKDFTKSIKLGLEVAKVYYNRGNAYFKQKKYKKAIADYTVAIKKDPKDTEALNNRAMAYEKSGNKKKANADRATLNKMAGNKFPPVDQIKFKEFSTPKGDIKIKLPGNWNKLSFVDNDIIEMNVSIDKIQTMQTPYSTGVRMSLNRNMSRYMKNPNPIDILEFWKGSNAQNTADYQEYRIVTSKVKKFNGWDGFLNKVWIQVSPESMPLGMYELVMAKGETLFYAYFQSPMRQFAYYKNIFDKAINTLTVNE